MGVRIFGDKMLRRRILNLSKSLDFQQLSYFQHFWQGVDIYQIILKRSMVIAADIYRVLLGIGFEFYIIMCFLLKYRLIFLPVLKVFYEPLSESNTERRVKISASISKQGT